MIAQASLLKEGESDKAITLSYEYGIDGHLASVLPPAGKVLYRLSQKINHSAGLQTEMLPLLNISAPFSDRIVADYLYRTATRRYLFSTIRDTFGYRRMPDNCFPYNQQAV